MNEFISLEALATADERLGHTIDHFIEHPTSSAEMAERLCKTPEGWTSERQIATMAVILAAAVQQLVIQKVMHDERTESGELDRPEGFLPG